MTEKWTRIEVDHPAVVEMWRSRAGYGASYYRGAVIVGKSVVQIGGTGYTQDEEYDSATEETTDGCQFANLYVVGNDRVQGTGSDQCFWEDSGEADAIKAAIDDLLTEIAGVS